MSFQILVPKVNGYQVQKQSVNNFLKISKTCQSLSFDGGFNFGLGTYNVPEGSSANLYVEARRAEFGGTDGTVPKNVL